jgi:hypothetical protein
MLCVQSPERIPANPRWHRHDTTVSFALLSDRATSKLTSVRLIVSIHIPKAAGQSFRIRLQSTFGSRALIDYGDWAGVDTPEAVARRESRTAEMRARKEELLRDYDVIHGHFAPEKYIGLFPTTEFAAFFRDPYQQAISHYQFLWRHPEIDHPAVKRIHETRMSLLEFIAAYPDIQSRFLGQIAVEDLAMVGLLEQYERGVALFEAVFGRKLAPETTRENVNPNRQSDAYPIDPAVRKAVEIYRAGDLEVYYRARERFGRLLAHYGL